MIEKTKKTEKTETKTKKQNKTVWELKFHWKKFTIWSQKKEKEKENMVINCSSIQEPVFIIYVNFYSIKIYQKTYVADWKFA